MKAFKIGRSSKSDVVVDHASVSRIHAELVATDEGRYYLTDCDSANGTFRRLDSEWRRIRQEFVAPDEPIALGEYETTPRKLALSLSVSKRGAFIPEAELEVIEVGLPQSQRALIAGEVVVRKTPQDDLPSGKVERDPETGEIIRRNE